MPGELMLINPRRKRRTTSRKRKSPVRRKTRRAAKRNPATGYRRRRIVRRASGGRGLINQTIIPAAIGGAGALVVDMAFGFLPIPAQFKTGPMANVAKIGAAIGLGMVARMALGKSRGNTVMLGAVTVASYNMIKNAAQKFLPNVPLGEYPSLEFVNAAQFQPDPLIGGYVPDYETRESAGISEYVTSDTPEIGEYVSGYDGDWG